MLCHLAIRSGYTLFQGESIDKTLSFQHRAATTRPSYVPKPYPLHNGTIEMNAPRRVEHLDQVLSMGEAWSIMCRKFALHLMYLTTDRDMQHFFIFFFFRSAYGLKHTLYIMYAASRYKHLTFLATFFFRKRKQKNQNISTKIITLTCSIHT